MRLGRNQTKGKMIEGKMRKNMREFFIILPQMILPKMRAGN